MPAPTDPRPCRQRPRVPPVVFLVTITAHDIPPRWRLEAQSFKLPSSTAAHARLRCIRWAHADAGVPPYRPLIRVSWPHSTAKPVAPSESPATPFKTPLRVQHATPKADHKAA